MNSPACCSYGPPTPHRPRPSSHEQPSANAVYGLPLSPLRQLGLWQLGWVVLLMASIARPTVADWPTYQYDAARSGSTPEAAPQDPQVLWTYQAPHRPIPAWDEPALWDGWSKVHDLKNRQVFDKALHVAVAGDHVYFGSSLDDTLYCVDASTGDVAWSYTTEGPIRLAPTLVQDRVYVGSDDGCVYCLRRLTGELLWKQSLAPEPRRIAGNGRVISPWAIRTGVVVVGDTAYCGAGVIPSDGVYVVALNATSGQQIWKREMRDLPAQGYMLASPTRLYVVTSRDTPVVLDAKTGERLYKVKGGAGGTYALLAGDTLLYGPSKTGDVNMVGQQDVLASFQGNHMIVAQPLSYLQNRNELSALDRSAYVQLYAERNAVAAKKAEAEKRWKQAKDDPQAADAEALEAEVMQLTNRFKAIGEEMKACLKWRTACPCRDSLILAAGVLIAGGDGQVMAVDARDGKMLWQRNVPGRAYGLAVSDGKLWVSTDTGAILCLADDGDVDVDVVHDTAVPHKSYAGPIASPEAIPPEIHGPFAEFIEPGKVRIQWDTTEPMTSQLAFGIDLTSADTQSREVPSTEHEFVVDDVQREVIYRYQVGGRTQDGREVLSEAYRFDSHLEYLPTRVEPTASPYPEDAQAEHVQALATAMVQAAGTNRGYALVLGAKEGQLAYELARASDLKVVVMDADESRVRQIRQRILPTGMYGTRIVVHHAPLEGLHYGPFLANLIVSERPLDETSSALTKSLAYCLRPAGGTVILEGTENSSSPQQWRDESEWAWHPWDSVAGNFWIHRRGTLPGTGEWTHQYASADNSACSQDDQVQGSLRALWWGRPGARPMPDRGNRNPPPVSANGRLYVQGNRTLFGIDAYNGTILWSKQIPTLRRANMPRDGSNMVAAETHVCLAMGAYCVAFDGQTGVRQREFAIPELATSPDRDYDWGYVSRIGQQLFGTAVRRGSHYLGDEGEWYQTGDKQHVAKVTSDSIFSLNAYSGETNWVFRDGVILNSTITISNGRIYFITSRSDAAQQATTGRLFEEVLHDQVLMALDAVTGELLWERPADFSKCKYVTYMTHGNGTLLVTGTDEKSVFHTYAFDAEDGNSLWEHAAPDKKGHHTGQLAHPTIVGQRVYFNKHTYDLRTGEVLGLHNFNWHGCGVMSASRHTVFSRYEYHGMLDLKTNQRTEFLGIRSGCWLSLIPSGGLLLAPETSAGCSCGHSIQTSIAYVPTALAESVADGP